MSNQTKKPFLGDEIVLGRPACDILGGKEITYFPDAMRGTRVRELYEAHLATMEQTIADLRARVEAMEKAGDAMYKRLGSDIDYLRIDAKAEAMRERDEWLSTTTPTDHGK